MENKCQGDKNQLEIMKDNTLSSEQAEQMSLIFKVFGDPNRIRILHLITLDEICVHEISQILELNQSAVSHQLRILRQHHLVKARRSGKHIFYSLKDEHIYKIFTNALKHLNE